MAPVLGYYDIRGTVHNGVRYGHSDYISGDPVFTKSMWMDVAINFTLAQPIRFLLEYTGTDFEDKFYKAGPAPYYDLSSWFNEKFNLGLDFPNLPYYIDGDVKLSQSLAILRYIGRKHNLLGRTEEEKIRVDLTLDEFRDLRLSWIRLCYNPQFDELKPAYLENLPKKVKQFSEFLGSRKWFAGDKITIADFAAYEELAVNLYMEPKAFDNFPNLQEFLKRFEALEKVAAYMNSDRYLARPINFYTARFNN